MFFLRSAILCILPLWAATVLAAPSLRPKQSTSGTIVSPANGAVINPGEAFDFEYDARADYGITSLNYTVFLLTSSPASFAPSADFATGHFFGRFAEPNYPGNPSPHNPAPAQLLMPDFSKNPGGFGVGKAEADGKFYLVVMEEYVTGNPTVGALMSLAVNEIMYNGTTSATTNAA